MMVETSDLEQLLGQKKFTRDEVKHLMKVINSRSVELLNSNTENNDQAKDPFFQEDKTSPCFGPHGAKTLDPSIAPNSVESLSEVPVVSVVASTTTRPRGRAAIYKMARSPYFMTDPLNRGHKYRWNAGVPSVPQGISRSNFKSLRNQALKRDASFLDNDDGLLDPKCKILKKSMENNYNEEPIAKDESPGMHTAITPDVISDKDYKNLKDSHSAKANMIVENVPFTTISGSAIIANGVNDATITRSIDATISCPATLNYKGSFGLDEEDHTNDVSIQSSLGLSNPASNIPEQRNSVSELLATESHLLTSFKGNDVTSFADTSNSSHATLPSHRNSSSQMPILEGFSDLDVEDDTSDSSIQSSIGSSKPESNISEQRNSVSELLGTKSHLLTSFKRNDPTSSADSSKSSHTTPPSHINSIFHVSTPR